MYQPLPETHFPVWDDKKNAENIDKNENKVNFRNRVMYSNREKSTYRVVLKH